MILPGLFANGTIYLIIRAICMPSDIKNYERDFADIY